MTSSLNIKPAITLVCPAMNEAQGIRFFLQQMDQTLAFLTEAFSFHVVVVDDGSSDGTSEEVLAYAAGAFRLTLCQLSRNFGKEAAIQAGLERYPGDAVIVLDTDLQHPLALIPQMLQHWQQGAAVVAAVKVHRGEESVGYRWASGIFYKGMQMIGDLSLENQSDYKLMDRKVVQSLLALPERIRFFRGLVHWTGFPSVELPFEVPARQAGDSSWGGWNLLRYSVRNLTAFSSTPLYLITLLGLLMLLVSFFVGAQTLWLWATGAAVTGFTTVILLLLMIGSLLLISLGIIGLYIARIYEEVKKRPLYLIKHETDAAKPEDIRKMKAQS